jgi:maleate cis-trans isomerase
MNVMPAIPKTALTESRARVGLIIPSVNTYSEPQFNRFAPDGLGIHVARARVAGPWKRPLPEMKGEIAAAAQLLSDCHPDVIVFHCTDTSMTQGPQGEGKILDIVKDATGIDAMATSRLVLEALQALGMTKVVLLTPYKTNNNVIDYLTAAGVTVLRDIAMKLEARTSAASHRRNGRRWRTSWMARIPTACSCHAPTPLKSRRSPRSSARSASRW